MKHVREPQQISEFEVQAQIFSALRALGINVRGEVVVQLGRREGRRATLRLDLAVFRDAALVGVIEVKARRPTWKSAMPWPATRQGRRHSELSVPVVLVCGMDEARSFIAAARMRGEVDWSWLSGVQ